MKKILFATLAVLFAAASLQAQVKFEEGSLKDMLAKAGTAGKYLFVDVCTSTSAPCKYMATKVFTQEKMGEYFNKTFVNARIDAEKGEGPEVAKKYRVEGYPTYLILDAQGNEVGRLVSGDEADPFLKRVQDAVAKIAK